MKKIFSLTQIIVLMAVMLGFGGKANAQLLNSNDVFYHSFNSPLSTRLNPSLFPYESTFYLTLPRVGAGLQMPFSYKNFADSCLSYDANTDTTTLNLNKLINLIRERGTWFGVNSEVDLLGFGFQVKNLSFNFATGVRVNTNLTIPMNATYLLTDGNTGEYAHIDMGTKDFLKAQSYAFAAFGASYKFPTLPLTIGARVNILDGIEEVSADQLTLDLTNIDNKELRVQADYLVHAAGMGTIDTIHREGIEDSLVISVKDGIPMNLGTTFDLGVKYDLGDFTFSASLLDFGPGIHWKENVKTIVPKHHDSYISFEGIDLSKINLIQDENGNPVSWKLDSTYFQGFIDSLENMVATTEDGDAYWSGVPTRMYLGASYTPSRLLRLGALFHGEWNRGIFYGNNTFRHSTTLSATLNLANWLELTASNGFTFDGGKFSALNPGVGVSLNLFERFHIYGAVDYLSNLYAVDVKAVRVYAGINITNNVREKRKRQEAERLLEEQRLANEALMAEADSLARAKAEAEARAKAEADSIAEANRLAMEAERARAQAIADSIARANAEAMARAKAEMEAAQDSINHLKAEMEARAKALQDSINSVRDAAAARERAIQDSIARAKEAQRVREEKAFVEGYRDEAHYETGKDIPIFSELNEDSWVNLKNVMDRNPKVRVLITGHTDNVGKPANNLDLSQRRADNFKKILVGKGIDGSRIETVGKGDTEPIDTNKTKEGRARNRRIEVSIAAQE